jgi:hypothetical protein
MNERKAKARYDGREKFDDQSEALSARALFASERIKL